MNLEQFHHGIRAARDVLRHQGASGALVIMGSQSILASYSAMVLDSALMMSAEVDILPIGADRDEINRLSDHLDGSLGQESHFHQSFGFHIDGISIETSVLPDRWVDRLIPEVDPNSGATGWCLDPHDLAVARLIAGRPKDNDFVDILVAQRLVDPVVVREGSRNLTMRGQLAQSSSMQSPGGGYPKRKDLVGMRIVNVRSPTVEQEPVSRRRLTISLGSATLRRRSIGVDQTSFEHRWNLCCVAGIEQRKRIESQPVPSKSHANSVHVSPRNNGYARSSPRLAPVCPPRRRDRGRVSVKQIESCARPSIVCSTEAVERTFLDLGDP